MTNALPMKENSSLLIAPVLGSAPVGVGRRGTPPPCAAGRSTADPGRMATVVVGATTDEPGRIDTVVVG